MSLIDGIGSKIPQQISKIRSTEVRPSTAEEVKGPAIPGAPLPPSAEKSGWEQVGTSATELHNYPDVKELLSKGLLGPLDKNGQPVWDKTVNNCCDNVLAAGKQFDELIKNADKFANMDTPNGFGIQSNTYGMMVMAQSDMLSLQVDILDKVVQESRNKGFQPSPKLEKKLEQALAYKEKVGTPEERDKAWKQQAAEIQKENEEREKKFSQKPADGKNQAPETSATSGAKEAGNKPDMDKGINSFCDEILAEYKDLGPDILIPDFSKDKTSPDGTTGSITDQFGLIADVKRDRVARNIQTLEGILISNKDWKPKPDLKAKIDNVLILKEKVGPPNPGLGNIFP